MPSLVDLHAHVLPAIDDGPADQAEAMAMLRAASDSGTTTIAATPHLRPDFPDVHVEELGKRCGLLRDAITQEGIPIRVASGAEVSFLWAAEANDDELRLASYEQRGTDLLIETPSTRLGGFDRLTSQLRDKGYRIILGHPERNLQLQHDDGLLNDLLLQGVLLQVNAQSILGADGGRIRRFARRLLTEGLAHVIASDGHRGTSWRPVTKLAEAADAAAALVGPERAVWMTEAVPAAIISGSDLPDAPPVVLTRKRLPFWR